MLKPFFIYSLYPSGPFWICVTLVFCIAIMGNIADYLHSGGEGQHWRYDFRKGDKIFSYVNNGSVEKMFNEKS